MHIAVVGAGIAGLGAAWLLRRHHEVTVFEAAPRLGGHAHTVEVEGHGRRWPVDVGFIVYNEPNYPHLTRLLEAIGAPTAPSDMSFAASLDGGRYEYAGSASGLVAQRCNVLRPRLWRMLADIRRFYRDAPALLADAIATGPSLGDYLTARRYSAAFVHDHLLPMGAAIWSSSPERMLEFPAKAFIRFFENHGLLRFANRPQWRTLVGGSRSYVARLAAPLAGRVRLGTRVVEIQRLPSGVLLRDDSGQETRFDQVVLAVHADQALAMLGGGASAEERALLGAFRYQPNRAVLHLDARLMPRRRAVWSSWNYLAGSVADHGRAAALTYWMNRLQPLGDAPPIFVSLNPHVEPRPELTVAEFAFDHPQFDSGALAAQRALPGLQGANRVWLCGSYCGYGFHEDALRSAIDVAAALGAPAPWARDDRVVAPATGFAQAAE